MSIPKNISTLKDRHCAYKVFIIIIIIILFLLLYNSMVMYATCSFYVMPVVYAYRRSGQVLKPMGLSA